MKKYLLFLILLWAVPSMASYVNDCVFKGEIVNEPKKNKDGKWEFEFLVKMSAEVSRADGGCSSNEGNKISVSTIIEDAKHTLKKGQVLWIRRLHKSYGYQPDLLEFTIMSEIEGEKKLTHKK